MDKEALQILNMFMTAVQAAKSKNIHEYRCDIKRSDLLELFKKAFPNIQDETRLLSIAASAMEA